MQYQSFHSQAMQAEHWTLHDDAQLSTTTLTTGGIHGADKEYVLGSRASLEHVTLEAYKEHEQGALITRQYHEGAESTSSVTVKTALVDQASSFYRGTISIEEHATGSQADQQQRALILSPTARTCAIPSLEVKTHEVQCSHGSAVGRFEEEELRYLLSRGLERPMAYNLLLDAFFSYEQGDASRLKEHCGLYTIS